MEQFVVLGLTVVVELAARLPLMAKIVQAWLVNLAPRLPPSADRRAGWAVALPGEWHVS